MTDESESRLGRVEYDATTGEYYASHAGEAPPSVVVPNAVAEITGRQVAELRPLQRVLDPDALDAVLDARDPSDRSATVEISFTYVEVEVTANSSGVVVLEPVGDGE